MFSDVENNSFYVFVGAPTGPDPRRAPGGPRAQGRAQGRAPLGPRARAGPDPRRAPGGPRAPLEPRMGRVTLLNGLELFVRRRKKNSSKAMVTFQAPASQEKSAPPIP